MTNWFNIYPLLFLVAVLTCFTLPGLILLEKAVLKINPWEKVILSTSVGLIIFTLIAYLFIILNITLLLIIPLLIINFFELKKITSIANKFTLPGIKHLLVLILIFSVGVIGQMAVIAPSGRLINGDLVFWSAHGHDSMWHIALMEELKKGYPLQNPVFAGERLVNYHFFSDIAPSMFSLYFQLPNLDLYFRYFPLLSSLLLGSLAFLLGKKLGNSFGAGLWSAIITYFAGSFGYIVTWIHNQIISGESIFWATQIQSSVGNPPQILAFIIMLTLLYFIFDFIKDQKNLVLLAICSILAGSLIVFKVYGGVVVLIGLGLIGVWQLIQKRRPGLFILAVTSSLIAATLYLPNSVKSTGFLIWEPWWFIRTMVVVPERLNLLDWELRRQTYLAENNIKRVALLEITSFFIFLFGNLGVRFIGLFETIRMIGSLHKNYFYLLLFTILLSSFIFPLLFLQKGVASNSIQFMQYFLLLMGIIAGVAIDKYLKHFKISVQIVLGLIIIGVAAPTQIGLIKDFYNRPPVAKISQDEQAALEFLKNNSPQNSIVLAPPYDKNLNQNLSTPQIWDWFDTSYVAALSSRRVYLADSEQVDIMGYDLNSRSKIVTYIFLEENPLAFKQALMEQKIDYLYFPANFKQMADLLKTNLIQVYKNPSAEIWKVN